MNWLRELTAHDLARCPIWRYEGESDDTALVFPIGAYEDPDCEAYIARTRFVLADDSEWWGYCSPTDDSGLPLYFGFKRVRGRRPSVFQD